MGKMRNVKADASGLHYNILYKYFTYTLDTRYEKTCMQTMKTSEANRHFFNVTSAGILIWMFSRRCRPVPLCQPYNGRKTPGEP